MIRGARVRLNDLAKRRLNPRAAHNRDGEIVGISALFGCGRAFWVLWDGAKHKHLVRADYLEDAPRRRLAA